MIFAFLASKLLLIKHISNFCRLYQGYYNHNKLSLSMTQKKGKPSTSLNLQIPTRNLRHYKSYILPRGNNRLQIHNSIHKTDIYRGNPHS